MPNGIPGNMPGRRVFWESPDGQTQLIRYCDSVFGLEHRGIEVIPTGTFERINAYLWAEFMDDSFSTAT